MNFKLGMKIDEKYHSGAQIARLLTESWVSENMYCPRCGNSAIQKFENNRPVADFFCPLCKNQYELKSKNGTLAYKVADGAYETMIERIMSNQNPDFFFMNYSKATLTVKDFILIPKYFFMPEVIEKRKPLAPTARRAGWVGCNILLGKIPEQGKIFIISNGVLSPQQQVIKSVSKSSQLEVSNIRHRGWLMDVLNCVNSIETNLFTLNEIYAFEKKLQEKHQMNRHIKAKIRQQLQILRDKGFVKFLGHGRYEKL